MSKLDLIIDKYLDDIIKIRRDIHEHPELSLNEFNTSNIVFNNLKNLDLQIQTRIGKTGVVANLNPNTSKNTIMLRADMDALPLNETTDLDFKSKIKNVMHACGHDVHTAILVGTAKVLCELKYEIKGNVKFVFQPAEENNPVGGAPLMIEEGVLENPKVDHAVALHVWNFPVGKVAIKSGPIMGQSDRIFIKFKGISSHASAPHLGNDAIIASAHLITALQTIVSRNISPSETAVVTISKINGGVRYNVLADEVDLEGTVRCCSDYVSNFLPTRIEEIVKNIASTFNCDYEFKYQHGYPLTFNNKELTDSIVSSLKNSLGKDNVSILDHCNTGGEDFSYFAKKVPSTFFFLGCQSELNKDCCIIHNPNFVCDEDCIKYGIKSLVNIVLDYFNK